MISRLRRWSPLFLILLLGSSRLASAQVRVTNTSPVWAQNSAPLTNPVVAAYSASLRGSTVATQTFFLAGAQSGRQTGTIAFNSATNQVTLTPGTALRPGEWMTAHLVRGIQNTGGGETTPFQWSWHNAAAGDTGKTQILFRSRSAGFSVDTINRCARLGDVDGDGDLDAVSANYVWMNDGRGAFSQSGGCGTGFGFELGDLNGDGILDLAQDGGDYAYIFTNNGSGSFALQESVAVKTNWMNGLSMADFNGDGTLDLWLGVVYSGELHTNDGHAHFGLRQVITAADTYDGQAAILTDVNGDGSIDLWKNAPYGMGGYNRIYTNNGAGLLSMAWDVFGSLMGRADLKPGDFNNDGSVDVLYTLNGSASLILCTNNGHGFFGKMYEGQPFAGGTILDSQVGDFDGDGDLDVVCLKDDGTDGNVYILNNNGTSFAVANTNSLGVALSHVQVGDLDGDGTLDVVAVPASGTSIALLNTYPQWNVFDASGDLLSNGAAPQTAYGTEFGIVPVGAAVTNLFRLSNTNLVDFVFTSTVTTTNGAGTYQFSCLATNSAVPGLGGAAQFKLVCNPVSEGDHWGRVRIRDNGNRTFDIILHGTSPGFIVTNTQPKNAAPGAAPGANLVAQFSGRMLASSVTSNRLVVLGNQTALHRGSISLNTASNQITFDPTANFRCGETVFAGLADDITSEAGHPMIPYAWSFRVANTNTSCAGLFGDTGRRAGTNDARGAALGDLNGDGWLDLFVANYGHGSEVWLNDGAGALVDSGQRLGTNLNATSVALGDLDVDGDLDAIVTSWQQSNTVWLNNGSGVFSNRQSLTVTTNARKVVIADFDGDTYPDAFILNDGETNIVWQNNTAGTFGSILSRPGCHAGRDAAAGDLNGDGKTDLLIINADSSSEVWTNNGLGAFSVATNVHPAGGVSAALGDLDNDNDLDIVIGCTNGPVVEYRNDGHGGFGSTFANSITGFCGAVQLGCLDGDTDLELMHLRDDGGVSSVWLNYGGGVLRQETVQPLGVLPTPKGVEFGDVDNDGDLDAVLVLGTHGVRILINTRAGMHILGTNGVAIASAATPSASNGTDFGTLTGGSLTNWFVMTNTSPVNMTVDGINTNGTMTSQFQLLNQPSMIAAGSSACFGVKFQPVAIATQSAVFVFYGSWTGAAFQLSVQGVFLPPLAVTNTTPRNADRSVARASTVTAQFNLPVDPSTVTTNSFRLWSAFRGPLAGTVSVGGGNVSATFMPATNLLPGETVFAELNSSVRDADDLYSLPPRVWSFIAEAPKGSGLFTRRVLSPLPGNPWPSDMALGDLDGDGDLDAAIATDAGPTNGFMKILLNDGAANFTTNGQVFPCGDLDTEGTALGDLDNDGDLDVVVGQYNSDTYPEVLWNNGSAQFTMSTNVFPRTAQAWPAIGDLDGDGDLDVLFCGEDRADTVWFGDGAGHFTASGQQLGLRLTSPELADLDGDGDLDAVACIYDGAYGYLYVLLNNGRGVFTTGSILSFPNSSQRYYPCQIALGDLDADGDVDIAFRGEELACRLWLNNGQASFTNSAFPSPAQSYGFAMGDLNADRDLDILIGTWNYGAPYPVLNDGQAGFSYGPISSNAIDVVLIALGDLDGNGTLDALSSGTGSVVPEVLLNTAPLYLTVSAGAHGNIAPSGAVPVLPGASTSFLVTADTYYWVDSLLTNGAADVAAANARIYTSWWNSVTADGTVSVSFAEALAAHGTPEWWLAQYGWTNDFDAAETNDADGDEFPAWQEQIAGTDPTVSTSFFQCLEISSGNLPTFGKVLRWNAVSGRVYAVDGSTNLPAGWFALATNLPPTGVWTDAAHGAEGIIQYRLGVEKP